MLMPFAWLYQWVKLNMINVNLLPTFLAQTVENNTLKRHGTWLGSIISRIVCMHIMMMISSTGYSHSCIKKRKLTRVAS